MMWFIKRKLYLCVSCSFLELWPGPEMWDCWCSWRCRGSTIRYSEPGSARRFILKNLASLQNITRRILSIDVFDQNRTMPMPNPKQIRAKYVAASNLNRGTNKVKIWALPWSPHLCCVSPWCDVQLKLTKYGGSMFSIYNYIHSILHLA